MGIFEKIKKIFNPALSSIDQSSKSNVLNSNTGTIENKYIKKSEKNRYRLIQTFHLNVETSNSWDSFFSQQKENPKIIGFTKRSRRKFRYLYHNSNLVVTEAVKKIEIISPNETKEILYNDTLIDKFKPKYANEKAIIFIKKNEIAVMNNANGETKIYEFEWQPFTFIMTNNFWIVGTRETYDGPGELYCFSYNGEKNWSITFKEKFVTMFGEIYFTPYLLEVSSDYENIFVASMDCLYQLDTNGNLITRIAISEIKKKELEEKYKDLQSSLSRTPKTEKEVIQLKAEKMAAQFSLNFDKANFNSPFAAFTHDPKTQTLYLLEAEGRLSSWSQSGSLKWINTFKEKGSFLDFVDDKVIVSLETGATFWLDNDGSFKYGAKFPMEVSTITLIPDKDAYLIVCKDHRLYELHKKDGSFVRGTEGHPGMMLFQINDQNIFFDGERNTQGYFWLAPPKVKWEHFEAKTFLEVNNEDFESPIAPEITVTKSFEAPYVFKGKSSHLGNRIIDLEGERIYVVEKPPVTDISIYSRMTIKQKRDDSLKSFLVCYNLNGEIIWEKQFYSDMYSLYISPDKKEIFTSIPSKDQVTYEPGHIIILSNDGDVLKKIKVDAHGFDLSFVSNNKAMIKFPTEGSKSKKAILKKDQSGGWDLNFPRYDVENEMSPFGVGLDWFESNTFKLERIDKKVYNLISFKKQIVLNLKAAIYQVVETPEGQLSFLSGTRLLSFYNQELEKVIEIKESKAIQSFVVGNNSTAVITKEEIRCYDKEGLLKWRYSSLPKSKGILAWYPTKKTYVWVNTSSSDTIVAAITEDGDIVKSQLFKATEYHSGIILYPKQDAFIAQTNSRIEIFRL